LFSPQAHAAKGVPALCFQPHKKESAVMGWEFAAVWVNDPDEAWKWMWRRVGDDDGAVLAQSEEFAHLDACIEDARHNGFDETTSPT
jgi:hypothetical protein